MSAGQKKVRRDLPHTLKHQSTLFTNGSGHFNSNCSVSRSKCVDTEDRFLSLYAVFTHNSQPSCSYISGESSYRMNRSLK